MAAGRDHVMAGVAFRMLTKTLALVSLYVAASLGVKVTESLWALPAGSTVPSAGEYVNVPDTPAVAFSCVAPSAVP